MDTELTTQNHSKSNSLGLSPALHLRSTINTITETLDPAFIEVLDCETASMATERDWMLSEGFYLCSIIGGYRKLLRLLGSVADMQDSNSNAAWHVLSAAGACAGQLVELIESPMVSCAVDRAGSAASLQTDLHIIATGYGHAIALPDADLQRGLSTAIPVPQAHDWTSSTLGAAIATIELGAEAALVALPPADLFPSANPAVMEDDTVAFQSELAAILLRDCTMAALPEIGSLCINDEWMKLAEDIVAAIPA